MSSYGWLHQFCRPSTQASESGKTQSFEASEELGPPWSIAVVHRWFRSDRWMSSLGGQRDSSACQPCSTSRVLCIFVTSSPTCFGLSLRCIHSLPPHHSRICCAPLKGDHKIGAMDIYGVDFDTRGCQFFSFHLHLQLHLTIASLLATRSRPDLPEVRGADRGHTPCERSWWILFETRQDSPPPEQRNR